MVKLSSCVWRAQRAGETRKAAFIYLLNKTGAKSERFGDKNGKQNDMFKKILLGTFTNAS